MADNPVDISLFESVLGSTILVILAAFGYTHKRISDVSKQVREDRDDDREEQDRRHAESQAEKAAIRVDLVNQQAISVAQFRTVTEQHQRLAEQVARLPTREDSERYLATLEARLTAQIKSSNGH
jgi:hypothetical protein